ncbi:MAG: hypothetical protein M3133_01760 [Actinomycetota bacterium]|nr:hypothetical protein [Actinomycetota bacterium]
MTAVVRATVTAPGPRADEVLRCLASRLEARGADVARLSRDAVAVYVRHLQGKGEAAEFVRSELAHCDEELSDYLAVARG